MAQRPHLSNKDYQELGKSVEKVIQKDYIDLVLNWRRLLVSNLIKGAITGFGGVLGATVLVALLLWLLSLAGHLPFLDRIYHSVQNTIRTK